MLLQQQDLTYLGTLLARIGEANEGIKKELGQRAKAEMNWDASLITTDQQVEGEDFRVGDNLSAKEWLCASFCSGEEIAINHLKITMMFVNENSNPENVVSGHPYTSGASGWADAPNNIRGLFAQLEAPLVEENVQVRQAIDAQGFIIVGLDQENRTWTSLGFTETFAAPEVLVDSVPAEVAAHYVSKIAQELKTNADFVQHGAVLPGFCQVRGENQETRAGPAAFRRLLQPEKMARAREMYGKDGYAAVQLVLCDKKGRLPWEGGEGLNQRRFW